MLTVITALTALSGCTAARWYLDRSSFREEEALGGRLRLTRMWNKGAAFSLPIPPEVLPPASAAALGMVWANRKRWCPIGAGLILGGGLSNLQERRRGRVLDYLRFPKAPEPVSRYVFNLADLSILAGGALCVWKAASSRRK